MELSWQSLFSICFIQVIVYLVSSSPSDIRNIKRTDAYTTCSEGWFTYGDKCYKVDGKNSQGGINWYRASSQCSNAGGYLATIYSREIQDFLSAFLLVPAQSSVWIGLDDRSSEGRYRWADGTSYDFKYYEPNEPSEYRNSQEDCMEMVYKTMKKHGKMGQWNDVTCERLFPFLCQKKKGNESVLDPGYCETDKGFGRRFEESCYHLIQEPKDWAEAEEYCAEEFNGHLASFDYRSSYFINYILDDITEDLWIGIKIEEETQQKWSSGWLVSFENWEKQEKYLDGTCVMWTEDGSWEIQNCEDKLGFLCEHSTSKATPPALTPTEENTHCPKMPKGSQGWRDFGGDYCFYLGIDDRVLRQEAEIDCQGRGGHLASFHSQAELDILSPFLRYYSGYQFYIGLIHKDHELVWSDGSEVKFTKWARGEPLSYNWQGHKRCVELLAQEMQWKQAGCHDRKGFICSTRKVAGPPKNTTEKPFKKHKHSSKTKGTISMNIVYGIIASVVSVSLLMGAALYYFKCYRRTRKGHERLVQKKQEFEIK